MKGINELAGMVIPVELLESFDVISEAGKSQATKDTHAAYRRSTKTLYLNRRTFSSLQTQVQEAVVAHEIAHALAHRDSLMDKLPMYAEFGNFGEEFLADRLACEWGFFEGLRIERIASYGQAYVMALEKWEDETTYCKEMSLWHIRRQAGLV
jgi:hypothetical protein